MSGSRSIGTVVVCAALCAAAMVRASDSGLVGYWKLQGDCRDYSGRGHHGENHRAQLETGQFDGETSYVEVADHPDFHFGKGEFSLSVEVKTEQELADVVGDLVAKFDTSRRTGFQLSISASAPGYNSTGNARHVQFGADNAQEGQWRDCGRPSAAHSSDALTVFNGDLYVGTCDGPSEAEWAHVYRYRPGRDWEDCGRLGDRKTRGVYTMVVHDGALYAATSASHGPQTPAVDFGQVFRYRGEQQWEAIGQPGENYRLNALASYRGKLYVCGFNIGPDPGHVYEYLGKGQWKSCGEFAGWPHTFAVHNGRLFMGYPQGEVFAYDGAAWQKLGNPLESRERCNQIHALCAFRGELLAGTWPLGHLAALANGKWDDRGRLGDATEVVGLTAYNGSLYAGTIPRAEVFRWDERTWTSLRRLFAPGGFEPIAVGAPDLDGKRIADWSRASSLAIYQGQLFVSTATCHRRQIEPRPDEIRGKVFSYAAGECVTYDHDLGSGWHSIVAVRTHGELRLYVDGRLATTAQVKQPLLGSSTDVPLWIGRGPTNYFRGKLRHVKLYDRALAAAEVKDLHNQESQ